MALNFDSFSLFKSNNSYKIAVSNNKIDQNSKKMSESFL